MIYTANVRLVPKVNGLQRTSGERKRYDEARALLVNALVKAYPRPVPLDVPVALLVTFWLRSNVAGDALNYIGALEDSISVGKVEASSRKYATALHGFPVLADDGWVRSFGPAPGEDRCLCLDCGFDRVSFAVEVL